MTHLCYHPDPLPQAHFYCVHLIGRNCEVGCMLFLCAQPARPVSWFRLGRISSTAASAPECPWLPVSPVFGILDSACYTCPTALVSWGLWQTHVLSSLNLGYLVFSAYTVEDLISCLFFRWYLACKESQ